MRTLSLSPEQFQALERYTRGCYRDWQKVHGIRPGRDGARVTAFRDAVVGNKKFWAKLGKYAERKRIRMDAAHLRAVFPPSGDLSAGAVDTFLLAAGCDDEETRVVRDVVDASVSRDESIRQAAGFADDSSQASRLMLVGSGRSAAELWAACRNVFQSREIREHATGALVLCICLLIALEESERVDMSRGGGDGIVEV